MKYLRYRGDFSSPDETIWRVDIYQEADQAFGSVGELVFDAESPLVIEWGEKAKEEVLCGSSATIKIFSPGDRTYADLYTIQVGRIRMDVYKDNVLHWSGLLDPEFYEEPYQDASDYVVSLTFSDFGILDRLKYNLYGMQTISSLLQYCIQQSGLNLQGIDESLISTQETPEGSPISLTDIRIRSDNFFDEDGVPTSLAEALKGVLQPLGLRMIQRCGKIYVYDLNGLYTKGKTENIEWRGDSSTMSVDSVYNDAKITWSPYAQATDLLRTDCWDDSVKTPPELYALNNLEGVPTENARYWSYFQSVNLADWHDKSNSGFTLWITPKGENAEVVSDKVSYFKIVPQYDGTESEGIAIHFRSWEGSYTQQPGGAITYMKHWDHGYEPRFMFGAPKHGETVPHGILFKSKSVWLPPVDDAAGVLLKVSAELLLDPRFNPFEAATNIHDQYPQASWAAEYNETANLVYVPVLIKYKPDGQDKVYIWNNQNVLTKGQPPITTFGQTLGSWEEYNGDDLNPNFKGFLCYYDPKNRFGTSGVIGWKNNHPAINSHTEPVDSTIYNAEEGQDIPYPDFGGAGGSIWIEFLSWNWATAGISAKDGALVIKDTAAWLLMKLPKIEIINNKQFGADINSDDVEYNGELNEHAKESIPIDTICGTSAEGAPTARGAYYSVATGRQIKAMTRAGRTSQVEDLLIGTLYSQYATPKIKLNGETAIPHGAVPVFVEDNQPGKKFLLSGNVENTGAGTSDATYIEFNPDEYKKQP